MNEEEKKSRRGFAAMDPDRRREMASKGGKAAHALGRAHRFAAGSEEARAAGRKGGKAERRPRVVEAECGEQEATQ